MGWHVTNDLDGETLERKGTCRLLRKSTRGYDNNSCGMAGVVSLYLAMSHSRTLSRILVLGSFSEDYMFPFLLRSLKRISMLNRERGPLTEQKTMSGCLANMKFIPTPQRDNVTRLPSPFFFLV